MPNLTFANLHGHDEYSLLDGAMKNRDMVDLAKKQGLLAVAQTNHGNIDGVLRHAKNCKELGIQPILGCEAYMLLPGEAELLPKKRIKRNHLTLLIRDAEGMTLLMKALTEAWARSTPLNNFPGIPIDQPLKDKWAGHIVVLSGCASSPFWKDKGLDWLPQYKDAFGEDLYAEIMAIHDFPQQTLINRTALAAAKELELKAVTTTDAHYCKPEDNESHQVLLAVGMRQRWQDPNRFKFDSKLNYMRPPAELVESHQKMGLSKDTAIRSLLNTVEIAEKCKFSPATVPVELPEVLPKGTDEIKWMIEKCHARMIALGLDGKPDYEDRLQMEIRAILKGAILRYIVLVADVVQWAKRSGIAVGPGRGSVSGSLVCWLLGITECDPIKYNLLFARFIAEGRVDIPDIDMDFEDTKRWMIEQYLREKYGQNNVAKVSTFALMRGKDAIKSVGRVFDVPRPEVQKMANAVLIRPESDSRVSFSIMDSVETFEDAKAFYAKYPHVVKNAAALEGQVKNLGIHAAGIVVAAKDLRSGKNGVLVNRRGEITINWDKKDLEHMGLMKLDVLGLKTCSTLESVRKLVLARHKKQIEWKDIDLEDPAVYKNIISIGKTATCFQIGSRGLQKFSGQLQTMNFKMLYDSIALWRPGCLKAGITSQYVERHHGREAPTYLNDIHKEICKDTYGLVLYQEQIMQFMYNLAGIPWKTADAARKVVSKKTGAAEFEKFKEAFVKGCIKKKTLSEKQASDLWDNLKFFGQYSFNKSHSVTYGMLGFWTAWSKYYYPAEYMCSYLNFGGVNGMEGLSKVPKIDEAIQEARKMGLKILLPDLNSSTEVWSISAKGELQAGLSEIKGISPETAAMIIEARVKSGGQFKTLAELLTTVNRRRANRSVIHKLILAGAFDRVLGDQAKMWKIWFTELYDYALSPKAFAKKAAELEPRVEGEWAARKAELEDKAHALIRYKPEFGSAGLGRFRQYLRNYMKILDIKDLNTLPDRAEMYCSGVATSVKYGYRENLKMILEKKGSGPVEAAGTKEGMGGVYGNLDDGTGFTMAVYNPDLYVARKATIEGMAGKPILVHGKWSKRKANLVVDKMWTLEELSAAKFRGLPLSIMGSAKSATWYTDHRKNVLSCDKCDLRKGCRAPVPGSLGALRAMVVAEAPGQNEDEQGKGLVGRAGGVLWDTLKRSGLTRDLFHVENVLHCRPKDNKFPGLPYVGKCGWLTEAIQKAKPLAILAMGNPAMYYFNGQPKGIREKNGTTEWNPAAKAWVTYCLHPSSTLHDPVNIPEFERGVAEFVRVLGEIS